MTWNNCWPFEDLCSSESCCASSILKYRRREAGLHVQHNLPSNAGNGTGGLAIVLTSSWAPFRRHQLQGRENANEVGMRSKRERKAKNRASLKRAGVRKSKPRPDVPASTLTSAYAFLTRKTDPCSVLIGHMDDAQLETCQYRLRMRF